MIKCVVWDLDNTLFRGVYLESPEPPADPRMAATLTELAGRGILQAIASRNPPEAAEYAARLTGHDFASVRCGWEAKSASIAAIMDDLGMMAGEVAFVDDDAMERAEVSYTVPNVLVLAPQDLPEAVSWPQFSPPVVTDEARRRGELYRQRRARQEESEAFGGSAEEFLRHVGTTVRITRADPADAPRLHELSVRTHQFNSTGADVSATRFGELIGAGQVIAVWLCDKFGDDGLVGGCIVESTTVTAAATGWRAGLVMMSCRALGRGVIDALLAWLCLSAKDAGADLVTVPCVVNDRNVPLRIALTGAGFRATQTERGAAEYVRRLDQPLPAVPDWVNAPVSDVTASNISAQIRQILADLVDDPAPLTAPAGTPLLREGVGLDSLGGALLLARVRAGFGVDVADEDLNLDSLATIGTLAAFVSYRVIGRQGH